MIAKLKPVPETKRTASKADPESASAPLDAAEFAVLMDAFAPVPARLALAVSGGPDSMALGFCTARWRKENSRELVALIVDHGLRAESAKEAALTAERLKTLGLETEILRWQHPPLASRLHIAARKARYRLLTEACKKRGLDTLLLAHQKEDQAETILMRLAKGSGINGVAGMSAEGAMEGVRLLRPFLDVPRARLAATCAAAKLSFVSDPSNASEKFARGRLRRVMPHLASEGLTVERLTDLGARAKDAALALDHYTGALLRVAGKMDDFGALRFDLEYIRAAPQAIRERALGAALQFIGGGDYAPERAALADLLGPLCADNPMASRTLHGCLITADGRRATILREFSAIADMLPIAPGETVLWDGRWKVTLDDKAEKGLEIRALGNPPHERIDALAPALRKLAPQGRARASLPALWRKGELALMPVLPRTAYASGAKAGLAALWPPSFGHTRGR